MADDDLDINQLAEALGVQRGTVYAWQRRYENTPAPSRVVGGAYLWKLDAWESWLSKRRVRKPGVRN